MRPLLRRRPAPPDDVAGGELNMMPYLDILMNLILFMLLSAAGLASFGAVHASVSTAGSSADEGPSAVTLRVRIDATGYTLEERRSPADRIEHPDGAPHASTSIPRLPGGALDASALTRELDRVKSEWAPFVREGLVRPEQSKRVTLRPEDDVSLEAIVATMDAMRSSPAHPVLFPDVAL